MLFRKHWQTFHNGLQTLQKQQRHLLRYVLFSTFCCWKLINHWGKSLGPTILETKHSLFMIDIYKFTNILFFLILLEYKY